MARGPTVLTMLFFVAAIALATSVMKWLYFQLVYHYTLQRSVHNVVTNVAGWVNLDKDAIKDSYDTQLLNVVDYMSKNVESNDRLAVLDDESEQYVRLHNVNKTFYGNLALLGVAALGIGLASAAMMSMSIHTTARELIRDMS